MAPYVLTALIASPRLLVYLSADMHSAGDETLQNLQWQTRRWNASRAYSDTKFHDLTLALYLARSWPDVRVNAVHPGWVPTRMGGPTAPDDLAKGVTTQATRGNCGQTVAMHDRSMTGGTGAWIMVFIAQTRARRARATSQSWKRSR